MKKLQLQLQLEPERSSSKSNIIKRTFLQQQIYLQMTEF